MYFLGFNLTPPVRRGRRPRDAGLFFFGAPGMARLRGDAGRKPEAKLWPEEGTVNLRGPESGEGPRLVHFA